MATVEERFWTKVEKRGHGGCWIWTACRGEHGYGVFRLNYANVRAHRMSWALCNSSLAPSALVLHKCDNRACVNPAHLFLGTVQDNSTDMVTKGRSAKGDRNARAKLTDSKVLEIRTKHARGAPAARLARSYGVSSTTVDRIVHRKIWTHL